MAAYRLYAAGAYPPRLSGYALNVWLGPTQPPGMAVGDIWEEVPA